MGLVQQEPELHLEATLWTSLVRPGFNQDSLSSFSYLNDLPNGREAAVLGLLSTYGRPAQPFCKA